MTRTWVEQLTDTVAAKLEKRETHQLVFALVVWTTVVALSGLVSGCADIASYDVVQDQIYSSYSGSYDESSGALSWSATFTVAGEFGTYVSLQSPSKVTLDGSVLGSTTDIFDQIDYESNRIDPSGTDITRPYKFVYTNNDSETFSNSFTLPGRVGTDAAEATQLRLNQTYSVLWWSNDPISGEDDLSITITSNATGGGEASTYADFAHGTSGHVDFTPSMLSQLLPGPARVQVCRTRSGEPVQSPEVGGSYDLSYCSSELDIMVSIN